MTNPTIGILLVLAGCCACSGSTRPNALSQPDLPVPVSATPTAAAAAKSTAKPSVTLTVSQALAQGASFEGQFIRLQGMFAGWSGKCQGGAAPLTRSDWMLEDAANPEECLYVSGPKPADISTDISGQSLSPGVARAPVLVQGILRRSEKGLFYLRIETP